MKKIITILTAAMLTASLTARADEGMWLLPLIQKMNADQLAANGCRLTPEQIYDINHNSLKDAIVHFGGGCTGEIISDQGLLVTNHHCGYSFIQRLSTPEHNYLEDGFFAKSLSEEMRVDGLSVTFLQSMTDVTDIIQAAIDKDKKEAQKAEKKGEKLEQKDANLSAAIKQLEEDAKAKNPHCSARVTPFYNTNAYYLIVNKTYNDVRFVGAPPASMGKFGGETDNWMWPRHTCDFSMFRVYAGKDNEPAAYSKDNVPYTPKQSLKISLRGVETDDFAMIMGYPGRTQRFMTAAQLQDMIERQDISIAARTIRQDIMWEARMADPVVNLQYASKYAGSSNGWKKWIGMRGAFEKLHIIEREEQKEAEFMDWVNAKKKRQAEYAGCIGQIQEGVLAQSASDKAMTLLSESVGRIEVLGFAQNLLRSANMGKKMAEQSGSSDKLTEAIEKGKAGIKAQYKDYSEPLDRKEAVALIKFYQENAAPEYKLDIEDSQIEAVVENLFNGTSFTDAEKLEQIKDAESIAADPATQLWNKVTGIAAKINKNRPADAGEKIAQGSHTLTKGLMEWKKGEASYPDANSTMRLTYGKVKAYSPKDGVIYKHYTTLKGVIEKEDPQNYEFRVPAKVKEIYLNKDYGQYANSAGELPTCFLINCDITGGNSGSPVLDADGALIGLAFDGNWESMSSDVMFEPDLQRCICVDIRYVLLMVDKFAGAGYLLDEMKILR